VRNGTWCRKCAGTAPLNIEIYGKIAESKGGKCLSNEYIGSKGKLRFECKKGHIWDAKAWNIYKGTWCKRCDAQSRTREKQYTIEVFRDIAKKKGGECLSEKYIRIQSKLLFKCKEGHIWNATPSHILNGTWCKKCAWPNADIDHMRKLAAINGGKCLSATYINRETKLFFECAKGHVFQMMPASIKKHWCPECAGNKKIGIERILQIAEAKGGKCLSKDYVNGTEKLLFECSVGHRWTTEARAIIRGHWCQKCAGKAAREKQLSAQRERKDESNFKDRGEHGKEARISRKASVDRGLQSREAVKTTIYNRRND
jgi:hypothetical protein